MLSTQLFLLFHFTRLLSATRHTHSVCEEQQKEVHSDGAGKQQQHAIMTYTEQEFKVINMNL